MWKVLEGCKNKCGVRKADAMCGQRTALGSPGPQSEAGPEQTNGHMRLLGKVARSGDS